MRIQVRKIDNSFSIIIPANIMRLLKLKEGSEVTVKLENDKIIIESVKRHRSKFISENE